MSTARLVTGLGLLIATLITSPASAQAPPPKKPANPPIKEVPIDLDLSDPKKKQDSVLFLDAPDLDLGGKNVMVIGLLRRELYRQALLLAARDELGLTTRDALLGEVAPDDLPTLTNLMRVNVELVLGKPHRIVVECGPAAASRAIWKAEAATPSVDNQWPAEALVHAEGLSRAGYLVAFKRAGLIGKANPVDAKAGVPADVEKLLSQMTFTAQFAAVRQLHQVIRTKGESPATLGAISRAYANLGMLTDTQWGGLPWVFKARGLLYAERLRQRDPKSPVGYWHRAYAAALAGMHATALDDLKEADTLRDKTAVPEWADLAGSLCRFDTAKLKQAAIDGTSGDLAALFKFLSVENKANANSTIAAGTELVKRVPECYRVHDALAESGGVAFMHGSTVAAFNEMTRTFSTRVSEMPGLPDSMADSVKQGVAEPDLVKALIAAGKSRDDKGEPSWAVLGHFAQEARLVQIYQRLVFLRYALAVSTTDYLDEVKPLVANHPLFPYFETFRLHPQRDRDTIQNKVRALKIPELSRRHQLLLTALATLSPEDQPKYLNVALQHGDLLYYDVYLAMRNFTAEQDSSKYAKWMMIHSPMAPMARASLVRFDWKTASASAAQWEKEAQDPLLFVALGRRAIIDGRTADAERLLTRAIELSPDLTTYRLLADMYKQQNKTDKWLATLEKFLEEPDPSLHHARVRVDIAEHFMSMKDFKKAQPYANAAAETYAAWAMLCAAKCAEGLDDWATAEQWVERVADRYDDSLHVWFYWCLRTGHGNQANAKALVEKHLKAIGPPRTERDLIMSGVYFIATGQAEKAPGLFRAVRSEPKSDFYPMLAAIELDAAGDAANRDKAFDSLTAKGPYESLVTLLRTKISKGEKEVPSASEIDTAFKAMPRGWDSDARYMVGRFLQRRGEKKLAADYFRECSSNPRSAFAVTPVLAGMALRELEEKK